MVLDATCTKTLMVGIEGADGATIEVTFDSFNHIQTWTIILPSSFAEYFEPGKRYKVKFDVDD